MSNRELGPRELFMLLKRWLLLIIAMPVVAALAAALLTEYLLVPVYKASTTLWVIKADATQINYNDLMLNRNLTKTYAEVAKSRAVMSLVRERLGLEGATLESLQRRLTVTPVRDTEILSFAMEDTDPARAAQLADAVAVAFQEQIRAYMKVGNVVVVDPAVVSTEPFKPRPLLNLVVASLLGLISAVGLVVLVEHLDTRLRSPEDVARHLGLPVLAVIPAFRPLRPPKRSPLGQQPVMMEGRVSE